VIVADLSNTTYSANDTFYLEFTGSTASECYTIINKIDATPVDGSSTTTPYTDCVTCIEQTTTVYSISGCTNGISLNVDFLSPDVAPGEGYYIEFTGVTPSGCYSVIEKIFNSGATDTVLTYTFFRGCDSCE
jgi:hypothetical protein